MLMMLVSCATVAPLNVLTCVLPVESIRRLSTFLRLESPIISLLQEWGRWRAGVESAGMAGCCGWRVQDPPCDLCQEVSVRDGTWWKVAGGVEWRG